MELASLFLWLASPHWPEGCWGPERGRTRSAGACELASTCLAGRCTLPAAPSAQRAISNPRRCLWPFSGLTPPHHSHPASCCWSSPGTRGPIGQGPLGYIPVLCPSWAASVHGDVWGFRSVLPQQCSDNTTSCESALSTL